MGLYIKDMEIPTSCFNCKFPRACQAITRRIDEMVRTELFPKDHRHSDCPLTEVPEPHGRLGDLDALHKLFEDQWHYLQVLDWNENPTAEANQSGINWCINTMHDDAPTVIPASEEG